MGEWLEGHLRGALLAVAVLQLPHTVLAGETLAVHAALGQDADLHACHVSNISNSMISGDAGTLLLRFSTCSDFKYMPRSTNEALRHGTLQRGSAHGVPTVLQNDLNRELSTLKCGQPHACLRAYPTIAFPS